MAEDGSEAQVALEMKARRDLPITDLLNDAVSLARESVRRPTPVRVERVGGAGPEPKVANADDELKRLVRLIATMLRHADGPLSLRWQDVDDGISLEMQASRGGAHRLTALRLRPVAARVALVVDDHERFRRAIARRLRAEGLIVDEAGDGLEALGACSRRAYALVTCDLDMPRLDGLGFFDELRERDPSLAARVVFVTAASDGRRQRIEEETGRPVLSKPFAPGELSAMIASLGDEEW